jgi:hypothetical protein
MMNILKSYEIFVKFWTLRKTNFFFYNFDFFENLEILNEIFENLDLSLQFDWPTGNEISSLVGQRWNTE